MMKHRKKTYEEAWRDYDRTWKVYRVMAPLAVALIAIGALGPFVEALFR